MSRHYMIVLVRKSITLFVALLLILSFGVARGQSRYEHWQKGRPFTIGAMFYDYHEYPEARGTDAQISAPSGAFPDMELVRRAGLNLISDVSHSNGGHTDYPGVSSVQAGGGSFMILGAGWAGKGAPTALGSFQKHVKMFADDPRWSGFCGVQLADEPHHNPKDPERYRPQRDWLVETYPHLLTTFCEGLSQYGNWTHEHNVIQSDGIIFQWYPYHTSSGDLIEIDQSMYAMLLRASEFCRDRRIGFFIARETTHTHKCESVYRVATYSALAHGAKGFIDFNWDSMEKPESVQSNPDNATSYAVYIDGGEQATPVLDKMARINREVANLGPALLKLRHVRTYQMDVASRVTWAGPLYHFSDSDQLRTGGLRSLAPKDLPIGVPIHLMVGFFRDDQDQEYFMVVNKNNSRVLKVNDAHLAQGVTMTFAPSVGAIERLNRETGQVERLELAEDHTYTFTLPAGTGDLFKYASSKPFVGQAAPVDKAQ